MTRKLWLTLVLSLSAAASADELPDYIRFAEDKTSARLEIAIRTVTLPTGQKVDLIGVVHIADAAYYRLLNQRFATYDSVLFELVGDPETLTAAAPLAAGETAPTGGGGSGVTTLQLTAARYLGLTFQLDAIDYTGKNMVHADFSAEQFAARQRERGETMLTLFARAMQAQMNTPMGATAMRELDTPNLIRILLSPDSAAEFKIVLAKMFDQMESMTAAMEGRDGSVVLSGRNDAAVSKVKEVLADRRQRRIAVFYGGAHMPGIELALTGESKAKVTGEEWLTAWRMPKQTMRRPADTTPAPGTATPAS